MNTLSETGKTVNTLSETGKTVKRKTADTLREATVETQTCVAKTAGTLSETIKTIETE